jgi:hypothetical protein
LLLLDDQHRDPGRDREQADYKRPAHHVLGKVNLGAAALERR